MKATRKGILSRLSRKAKPVDVAPVITDDVPAGSLEVEETDSYLLLRVSIDRADNLDVKASTRSAAMHGMDVLIREDPRQMAEIIEQAGAFAGQPLKAAIMRLAGVGRAAMANAQ